MVGLDTIRNQEIGKEERLEIFLPAKKGKADAKQWHAHIEERELRSEAKNADQGGGFKRD